jgi:hypothetical protein
MPFTSCRFSNPISAAPVHGWLPDARAEGHPAERIRAFLDSPLGEKLRDPRLDLVLGRLVGPDEVDRLRVLWNRRADLSQQRVEVEPEVGEGLSLDAGRKRFIFDLASSAVGAPLGIPVAWARVRNRPSVVTKPSSTDPGLPRYFAGRAFRSWLRPVILIVPSGRRKAEGGEEHSGLSCLRVYSGRPSPSEPA